MAARKARQRISYVLPLPNSPGGHRLGVNSLAVDKQGTLYSAGRDGVICSWSLGIDLSSGPSDGDFVPRPVPPPSVFRNQVQAHTHWVNDLVLCDSNETLVSCSSDLTVKLWRPNAAETQLADTIGVHSDYVKCLAVPDNKSNWVASGGLDRKIKVWDLTGKGEMLQIDVGEQGSNPKGSVYSLGIGSHGGILASGGPESVVRIWDPRSGQRVTKFVGHTDNIRAILVADEGDRVLTASSDSTVKMWSLKTGRLEHTLSMHNHSVWSLYSDHPTLAVFHSSDKSGLIAKTDLRNVQEIEHGISVAVAQEHGGVSKVVACGDYLWTATSRSSINRWMDVDTDRDLDGRPRLASASSTRTRVPTSPSSPTSPTSPRSLRGKIPISAVLSLSTSTYPSANVRDPDAVTVYSVASVRQPETIMEADGGVIVPVNDLPDETIEGQNGLIKHFILNDRRSVLTLDTAGEVTMWDLLKCVPVKAFGRRQLEEVAAEVNTTECIATWCQVDTRTGRLACVLEDSNCFEAEMYADEAGIEGEVEFRDDQRINLGKWVLRYLFSNLIDEEISRDAKYRRKVENERRERETFRRENAPPQISLPSLTMPTMPTMPEMTEQPRSRAGSQVTTPIAKPLGSFSLFPQTPGMSIGIATPAPPYFTPNSAAQPSDNGVAPDELVPPPTNGVEKVGGGDYFSDNAPPKPSTATSESAVDDTPATPTLDGKDADTGDKSIFGKWKSSFGAARKLSRASTDLRHTSVTEEKPSETEASQVESFEQPDPLEDTLAGVIKRLRQSYETLVPNEKLRSALAPSLPNETPVLKPPRETAVIVQEDRPDSGGVADLYRGTVGSVGEDADALETVAPAWLGDLLLHNRIPLKETIKVSFVLVPWRDELPVLPSESGSEGKNSRLNANRMLRARKIMAYVAEHLSPPYMTPSHVPEPKEGETEPPKPEDWLELVCNDQVLPVSATLFTIKQYVWKGPGDVIMHYRQKRKATGGEKKEMEVSVEEKSQVSGDSTPTQ